MRILIIDDEKYSRIELIHQIRQNLLHAEISEVSSGVQAMEILSKQTFDILFIDIHLGDMDGMTIASLARKLIPQAKIIFATAYSEYALKAFELQVDDYILKPFNPERVRTILERCIPISSPTDSLMERLAISCNRHTILLDIEDITYIETDGAGRGCVIHTLSSETQSDNTSLSEYENRLANHGFFRIHKTCIVQLKHIQDIFPWGNSSLALRVRGCDTALPISRDRVKELRQRLKIS